ncbi:polymer-forming cytoskeletal protein [Candidatus Peregrinibacteria bacterium]|nr:polymer-forming cytoskeletal protein [Candidatus Peregrinibacteria bacterium]
MKKFVLILLFSLLVFPSITSAASFKAGEEVFVDEEINEDAYIAGGTVRVSENINGDLMLGGGRILINSNVSQDLTVGGGDMVINGEVGDDMRVGGGNIVINSIIKDDLFVGAGNVNLSDTSFVGGDLIFGGGNVFLDGGVNGNIVGAGGNININGEVIGNVKIFNAEKITFGPNAKIKGSLEYRSTKEAKIEEGVVEGGVIFNQIKREATVKNAKWMAGGILAGYSIFSLLASLLLGLVILLMYRTYSISVTKTAYKSPFKSLGIGLLALIIVPISVLILFVTVIGLPLAFITLLSWIILLMLGKVFASMIIGWQLIKVKEKKGFGRLYGGFALGALIYSLLIVIPIVGWLAKFVAILIALGAVIITCYELHNSLIKKKLI